MSKEPNGKHEVVAKDYNSELLELLTRGEEVTVDELLKHVPEPTRGLKRAMSDGDITGSKRLGAGSVKEESSKSHGNTKMESPEYDVAHSFSDSETCKRLKQGNKLKDGKAARPKTSRSGKASITWTRFSYSEEVILIGCVLRRFFNKGSLTSTPSQNCWGTIKSDYDKAWKIYAERDEKITLPQNRPKESLARHFKFMKAKLSKEENKHRNLRDFYVAFEKLNIDLDK